MVKEQLSCELRISTLFGGKKKKKERHLEFRAPPAFRELWSPAALGH